MNRMGVEGQFRTLGGLSLGHFQRVKPLLLLAYLALEGPTPRRHFRTLLWPDARQPDSSLRVALHALNEAVPGALIGAELLECAIYCDAARLLELRGGAALTAYTGPFLHGTLPQEVSEEFQEWTEAQCLRLAQHVRAEALALAEQSQPETAAHLAAQAYWLPGAPPPEAAELRRLLALSLPGSPLETGLRAELRELTGAADLPPSPGWPVGRMLGRAAELDRLLTWATRPGSRWAVVSGPGGVGKSTLARALLRELTLLGRSATLVDAEGAALPGELLSRLAQARAPGQSAGVSWGDLTLSLGQDPVILLDGLDDLGDLAGLLDTLSAELPGARWVLTGRRHLGHLAQIAAGDALTLTLGGLDVPAPEAEWGEIVASSAVALFVREAARVRRDFTLSAGGAGRAGLIASLVRRLMGLPLALMLAASWLRLEDLEAVHARVLNSAGSLVSPDGDGDGRRGLLLVAGRSWTLLTPDEQRAALRLSVCADLDPADAPALGVPDALLDALLSNSFLEAYLPGSERLRVYPALGGLLQAQARAQPELMRAARATHARHYLGRFAAQAPDDPAVDAERGNLHLAAQAALEGGTLEAAAVNHLLAHHDRRGLYGGSADVFAALADQAEDADAPPDVQAAVQIACMWLAYRAGRLLDAQTLASRFLQGPLADDATGRMKALNTLASVRGEQGQMQAANTLLRQAIELARQLGDHGREVGYQMNLISSISLSGDVVDVARELTHMRALLPGLPEATAFHVRRLTLSVQLFLPDADLVSLSAEAQALEDAGHSAGDLLLTRYSLIARAQLALRQGRLREAEVTLARLRQTLQEVGSSEAETELALLDTRLLYAQGRTPHARRAARKALGFTARSNNPWQLVELLLSVSDDLQMAHADGLEAWLTTIADDENLHFEQRGRAQARLDQARAARAPRQSSPLEIGKLRVWLYEQLPHR